MRDENEKYSREEGAESTFSESLLASARENIISNFPNRQRIGCPDVDKLEILAFSNEHPSESMKSHLLKCSPCFLHFTSLKSAHPHIQPQAISATKGMYPTLTYGLAGLLLCVTVISTAIMLSGWLNPEPDVAVVSKEENQLSGPERAEITPSVSVGDADSTDRDSGTPPKSAQTNRVSDENLTLNVREASVIRGTSDAEEEVRARRTKTQVTIALAPDSPAGLYEVKVFDGSGRQIGPTLQRRSDGRTVSAVIDFSRVSESVRVCVSLEGEVPDCFPVTVRN